MNRAENYRRTILFDRPEFIPMTFAINPACWSFYDQNEFCDLIESHRLLFPDFKRPELPFRPQYLLNARADEPYTDPWKCTWETSTDGITGSVCGHPLRDWSTFETYRMPDFHETDGTYPLNLEEKRRQVETCRKNGELVRLGLPHGHTWLRLQDIRGYEDTVCDLFVDEPRILKLLGMIEEFNCGLVEQLLTLRPDLMSFAEDLGMQHGPMISPDLFRRHIKPIYTRMMKMARDRGCMIHMHSDGDIRTLVNDLVDSGVQVVNLQDLVNGIEWIAANLAQKTCIELDIDRQNVTVFGTPGEVDKLIREEVSRLGSKQGGLMMVFDLYPETPVANIKALMDAMERYSTYYS